MGILARFPGTSGDYASTPDNAAFSALTDFSVLLRVAADDWTPAAVGDFAAQYVVSGNQRSWIFRTNTAGNFVLALSTSGTAATTYPSTATNGLTNGTTYWVLVTRASASGDIKFYTAADAASPPAIGSFTQLGTTVSGMTGALFNSTAALEVGSSDGGASDLFDGDIRRMALYTGIYGSGSETLVRDFSPTDSGDTTATSWAAATTGETWTLNGGDVTLVGDTVTGIAAGTTAASGSGAGTRTVLGSGAGSATATGTATGTSPTTVTGTASGTATSSGSAVVAASAGSPGRPLWDTGYTFHLEAAFSATTGTSGVWDEALWDSATWGPDLVWSDLSTDAFSWSTILGRSREDGHFTAAKTNVTIDNKAGDYTPENLSGPYVAAGVTGIRAGRPMRGYLTRDSDGATKALFYGTIEDWDETVESKTPRITFVLVDGIADLAAADGYEQTAVGSGELVGPRVHRVLDNAEWEGDRNIDLGSTTMQPTTLAQNAWAELLLTADSDGGEMWVEPDNTAVFQDREAPLRNTRSNTVQWTFTDDPTPGALHYEDLRLATGLDMFASQIALSRAGGTVRTFTDLAARALYRRKSRHARNDLICDSDLHLDVLGQTLLARLSDPSRRPRQITLRPKIHTALWPVIFDLRIRDRVEVTRKHERANVTITHDCLVDGIEHRVSSNDWVTVVRLASTVGLPRAEDWAVWDTSTWDNAYWGL